MIRGVRGAITVEKNDSNDIILGTEKLLTEMIKANKIEPENVASVFISVTEDITADFPAKAVRRFEGWSFVPVMCMREMPVPGALELCIRIMIHVNTMKSQNDIHHIYLEKAIVLRPDLVK
ncbi:chorismate mutase [Pseudoneobacillus sp. C159]